MIMTNTRQSAPVDWPAMAARFSAAVGAGELRIPARDLSITTARLHRLYIGWSRKDRAWTFPLREADGGIVGINRRFANGDKRIIAGGKVGLYLPDDIEGADRLLVAEGGTDAAALLDMGFAAVGRFSCNTSSWHIVELVQRIRPTEVVAIADHDGPGQRGAELLASTLVLHVPKVSIITTPATIKDVRAWRWVGATSQDIKRAIEAAQPRVLSMRVKRTRP